MTTPDQPKPPTVLKFRSASGRTEFALTPEGTVKVNVLHGSDTFDAADITAAARTLSEASRRG